LGSFETVAVTFAVLPAWIVFGRPVMAIVTPETGFTVMVAEMICVVSARGVAWKVTVNAVATVGGAV
jgi:hypothetical protein